MSSISFIGLGAMGRAIVPNLIRAGYEVTVWNRSAEPVDAMVAQGARPAATVAEALQAGTVLSMLADDAAVQEVFLDSEVLAQAPPGTVHANLSTVSTAIARRAAEAHAAHGIGYVASPVFGQVAVAAAGNLNVLAAGDPEVIDRLQPVFEVIGTQTWRLGDHPEQANISKIIGNYLLATVLQSMGEAITLAEHSGVDTGQLIELLSGTLFPGRIYANYGSMIAERRFQPPGFTTVLGRKDLHLALDSAAEHGVTLPLGELLRAAFDQTIEGGRGGDDWAAITELLPRVKPDASVE